MGKPTICIGENKDADQLRGNGEADQRLCFRYSDSTIPPQPQNFKLLACFCSCTGWFVSDLFRNHIVGFPTRRLKYVYVHNQECGHSLVQFQTCAGITQQITESPSGQTTWKCRKYMPLENQSLGFLTMSDTNQPVHSH